MLSRCMVLTRCGHSAASCHGRAAARLGSVLMFEHRGSCRTEQADKQPDFMLARVTEGLVAVPAFQQRLWAAAHPGAHQPLGVLLLVACCTSPPDAPERIPHRAMHEVLSLRPKLIFVSSGQRPCDSGSRSEGSAAACLVHLWLEENPSTMCGSFRKTWQWIALDMREHVGGRAAAGRGARLGGVVQRGPAAQPGGAERSAAGAGAPLRRRRQPPQQGRRAGGRQVRREHTRTWHARQRLHPAASIRHAPLCICSRLQALPASQVILQQSMTPFAGSGCRHADAVPTQAHITLIAAPPLRVCCRRAQGPGVPGAHGGCAADAARGGAADADHRRQRRHSTPLRDRPCRPPRARRAKGAMLQQPRRSP